MKYLLLILGLIQIATYTHGNVINRKHWELNTAMQNGRKNEYYQSLGNILSKLVNKRCLNMFDDGCDNGDIPSARDDEEWITGGGTPGKRCLNMFDDGCDNGGLPGAGRDEEWIKNPGSTPGKRCLNVMGEGCDNGGIPGSGEDEEWIKDPGSTPGKRCLNTFDDGCANGGIPGSAEDEEWITGGGTPGKRCSNLFGDGCDAEGIPESAEDEEWITGQTTPKPDDCHNAFDDCVSTNKGLLSSGRQWIKYLGHKPGKRSAHLTAIRDFLQKNRPVPGKRSL